MLCFLCPLPTFFHASLIHILLGCAIQSIQKHRCLLPLLLNTFFFLFDLFRASPLLDLGIFSGSWLHLYTCFSMTPNHHRGCLEHGTCT
uniref:Uncharacterized protein n=1 Tax=Catagonus wagneri TaxID=51154 RepID=A0A8C3X6C6_9CETA